MEITIDKVIYPGKSLARKDGLVVLCDEGLPGETLAVSISKKKKKYLECSVQKVITPSPRRVDPRCSHYRACAAYQYIEYPFQLEIKKSQLAEFCSRIPQEGLKRIGLAASPRLWGYRNKISLKVFKKDRQACLGYNLPGYTNRYIEVKNCFLVSEPLNQALAKLSLLLPKVFGELGSVKELAIRESSTDGKKMLVIGGEKNKDEDKLVKISSTLITETGVDSVYFSNPASDYLSLLEGESLLAEHIAGKVFFIGPTSFFQVNTPILEKVIGRLQEFIQQRGIERFADLYSGVGLFGIIFADRLKEVIGVEDDRQTCALLKKNLAHNSVTNYILKEEKCENCIDEIISIRPDMVMVDPPRSGLDARVVSTLSRNPVPHLAYLSCDPATLARDLMLLSGSYELIGLDAFDFFAHTPHIETLALLRKR